MKKVAVIGAGLAGLSFARFLKDHAEVAVFEKSRGVGGRLSTRRADPYAFDHGAQYFTARHEVFQAFIKPMLEQGIIKRWDARYVRFDGNQVIAEADWANDEPRYVAVPGMNQVGKYFADHLDVRLHTKIISMNQLEKWRLIDEQGNHYDHFDWVVSAAPGPQLLDVFPDDFACYADVKKMRMEGCFALMLGFEKPLALGFDAAHVLNSDVGWMAANHTKPGRPEHFALMVHSSVAFAQAHMDDDVDELIQHLIHETSHVIGQDVSVADHKKLHRWRYANNEVRGSSSTPFIDCNKQLAACGDWTMGGRVEGAFVSAYELAKAVKSNLG